MAKRTLRAEQKKECPSCGLGVSLESTICEFCGWNFEEEDEWILQIEKLERDLMLEKQKYEPGTVDHMLESTLRSPLLDRVESAVPQDEVEADDAELDYAEEPEEVEQEAEAEETVSAEPEEVRVRRVRSARASAPEPGPGTAPSMPIRRVRVVASRQKPGARDEEARPVRKTRTMRRVKK
ncbi:MAG: hypothetical protein JSV90_01565 [Methanobacteriota archaeon]|nr:MAG: hypothetical protein JSV90_01565 [Euryarchaeota archaeon]